MLVALGPHRFDITYRAIVIGAVDPSLAPTSEGLPREAAALADAGADALEVGDPGGDAGGVALAVRAVRDRWALPVAVRTSRRSVARACLDEGAVLLSGHRTADEHGLLAAVAAAGAAVVLERDPGVHDVARAVAALDERGRSAERAGITASRIVLDAGVGRGPSREESVALLRDQHRLASLGRAVMLDLVDAPLASVADEARSTLTSAALAVGIIQGARLVRTREVRAARRVAHVAACLLEARAGSAGARETVS